MPVRCCRPQTLVRAAGLAVMALASSAVAQTPVLAADISRPTLLIRSTFTSTYGPSFASVGGNYVFFAAGGDIWFTDGTPGGTSLVLDLDPVAASVPSNFTSLGTTEHFLFVTGAGPSGNKPLWVCDGFNVTQISATAAPVGPVLVYDPMTGPGDAWRVFYVGTTPATGNELYTAWSDDGVTAQAAVFTELVAGATGGSPANLTWLRRNPVSGNPTFMFTASNPAGLYVSDGTVAGTVRLSAIPGSPTSIGSNGAMVQTAEGQVVFNATTASAGAELWKSDGTNAGTALIGNIAAGNATAFPLATPLALTVPLAAVNGEVYTWASTNGSNNRRELFRVNPNTNTITQLTTLNAASTTSQLTSVIAAGNRVFFGPGGTAARELWSSDGTLAGTARMSTARLPDITATVSSDPANFFAAGSELYYAADDGVNGVELWVSDGTTSGTQLVKAVNSFETASPLPLAVIPGSGDLFVGLDDGWTGREPWVTDGTSVGTELLADLSPGTPGSVVQNAETFPTIGALGKYIVALSDGRVGNEVWVTDGTAAGTKLLKDITPGVTSSFAEFMTKVGDRVYFRANQGGTAGIGYEVFRTDGTPEGTGLAFDLNPGGLTSHSYPQGFQSFAGGMFLFATSASTGWEPVYISDVDNPTAFTFMNINPTGDSTPGGTSGSAAVIRESAQLGSMVIFSATDGSSGFELWAVDASAPTSPFRIADINPTGDSAPLGFERVGGLVYFTADDGVHGRELWKTDGTTAGTGLVADIFEGLNSSAPTELTDVFGVLHFAADDGTSGRELFRLQGGSAVMVDDLNPGSTGSDPRDLTVFGTGLLLRGTSAGTTGLYRVADSSSGFERLGSVRLRNDGIRSDITVLRTKAYFRGIEGGSGQSSESEVFVTDGTSAGTVQLSNINDGGGSQPAWLDVVGDKLFFMGGNFDIGFSEPHSVQGDQPCPSDVNSDGTVDFGDFLLFFNCFDTILGCGDVTGDGVTDFADFLEFFNGFDNPC